MCMKGECMERVNYYFVMHEIWFWSSRLQPGFPAGAPVHAHPRVRRNSCMNDTSASTLSRGHAL